MRTAVAEPVARATAVALIPKYPAPDENVTVMGTCTGQDRPATGGKVFHFAQLIHVALTSMSSITREGNCTMSFEAKVYAVVGFAMVGA